ncbi:MAG: hypothetical protein ABI199_07440 [Bacteroidia bacterium]
MRKQSLDVLVANTPTGSNKHCLFALIKKNERKKFILLLSFWLDPKRNKKLKKTLSAHTQAGSTSATFSGSRHALKKYFPGI